MKDEKKLDTYRLAMFPLMLQALYNAKVVLNGVAFPGNKKPSERQLEFTLYDITTVLSAFSSIGVFPRFRVRKPFNEYDEDFSFDLRHFSVNEKDKVLELFSPEQAERDIEMIDLSEELDKTKKKAKKSFQDLNEAKKRIEKVKNALLEDLENSVYVIYEALKAISEIDESTYRRSTNEKLRLSIAGFAMKSRELIDNIDLEKIKKDIQKAKRCEGVKN